MSNEIHKRDARGALEVREPEPGVLRVKVSGHLSEEVGRAFPDFARAAALRAERCEVQLDVRELDGFDPAVRDAWVKVVLEFRARIARVNVVSSKFFITLAARAAGVALGRLGVRFEVNA
jgi:hypothetical protein